MGAPPRRPVAQHGTIRLIPTGRLAEPALQPLASSPQALDDLAALEGMTSGRLLAQEFGLPDLDPRELVFGRAGHTFINAAFAHTRPGGNRFNDEDRGAWYCAFAVETAIREVSYHLTRELTAVGRFDNVTDYGELVADFIGSFHDLCGDAYRGVPALGADPAVAYQTGQALARSLRHAHAADGIVYPSARDAAGTCLVAFHPHLVQHPRHGGVWRLTWQGAPEPVVSRIEGGAGSV